MNSNSKQKQWYKQTGNIISSVPVAIPIIVQQQHCQVMVTMQNRNHRV